MNSNIFPFKYIYENALFVHSKLFCKRRLQFPVFGVNYVKSLVLYKT